jgi:osmotically inducible protein OsmC
MKRTANAVWNGSLKEGGGKVSTESGAITGIPYTWKMRFEDETVKAGTNPEELIAAAHAACFAMQLSGFLTDNGTPPTEVKSSAAVEIIRGTGITGSALTVEAKVPGIDKAKFDEIAERAKAGCPVSGALGAIKITLEAKLVT